MYSEIRTFRIFSFVGLAKKMLKLSDLTTVQFDWMRFDGFWEIVTQLDFQDVAVQPKAMRDISVGSGCSESASALGGNDCLQPDVLR